VGKTRQNINETKSVKVAKGNSISDELAGNRWTHKVCDSKSGSDHASGEQEMDGDCKRRVARNGKWRNPETVFVFWLDSFEFLIIFTRDNLIKLKKLFKKMSKMMIKNIFKLNIHNDFINPAWITVIKINCLYLKFVKIIILGFIGYLRFLNLYWYIIEAWITVIHINCPNFKFGKIIDLGYLRFWIFDFKINLFLDLIYFKIVVNITNTISYIFPALM